jgi:hypothetical protein
MQRWKKLILYLACGSFCAVVSSSALCQSSEQSSTEKAAVASAAKQAKTNQPATDFPDSPGSVLAESRNSASLQKRSDLAIFGHSQQGASGSEIAQAEPPQAQTQSSPQTPVGTATAEAPDTSGIAASQPAGVAIAPAKQRRVRTLVIKVAAIAAGAVAIGTVVALTEATSSKPPGAR